MSILAFGIHFLLWKGVSLFVQWLKEKLDNYILDWCEKQIEKSAKPGIRNNQLRSADEYLETMIGDISELQQKWKEAGDPDFLILYKTALKLLHIFWAVFLISWQNFKFNRIDKIQERLKGKKQETKNTTRRG